MGVKFHPHSYVIFFSLKSDDKMTKDKLRFLSIYSWKEVKISYIVGVYSVANMTTIKNHLSVYYKWKQHQQLGV